MDSDKSVTAAFLPQGDSERGRVQIVNNNLVAENGSPIRGEAMFMLLSAGDYTLSELYDLEHWRSLRDDFNLNTIRLYLYRPPQNWPGGPGENCFPPNGSCFSLDHPINSPDTVLDVIDDVVDIAASLGMYLILDYHPVGGHNSSDAAQWWAQIAPRYKDRTHVIYELANEPVAWNASNYGADDIQFEEDLYTQIRSLAPETHIILWSFANGGGPMLQIVNSGTDVSYENASVAFHPYGSYDESAILLLKSNYPVINTEIGGSASLRQGVTQSSEDNDISWIWLNGAIMPGRNGGTFSPFDVYWPADPAAVDMVGSGEWGSIDITQSGSAWEIELQNSLIYAKYANAGTKQGIPYDRIVEFRLKSSDTVVANKLDGRHSDGSPGFYTITGATVTYDGPEKKTVRIIFGSSQRVTDVTITKDSPVLQLDYQSGGHNLDYGIVGDTWEIYGAEAWQTANGWSKKYPTLQDNITYSGSYYRSEWGDPGSLNYNGSMIMGRYSSSSGYGAGLVLSFADNIRFLKLIDAGNGSGFERWIDGGAHTAYMYPVTNGAAEVISMGQQIVDGN